MQHAAVADLLVHFRFMGVDRAARPLWHSLEQRRAGALASKAATV